MPSRKKRKATEMYVSGSFLSKDDVPGPLPITITSVELETVGSGKDAEKRPVAQVDGAPKPKMALNDTNWDFLVEEFDNDLDQIEGARVVVFVDPSVMFKGKRTGGLRLRLPEDGGFEDDEDDGPTKPRRGSKREKPSSSARSKRRRSVPDEDDEEDDELE